MVLGISLALIMHGNRINFELLHFINPAARDCVIRAKTIVVEALQNEQDLVLVFEGKFIAADMAYYLKNGNQCYRYHELFFNGLLAVLYGAYRHTNKDLEEYVHSFEQW